MAGEPVLGIRGIEETYARLHGILDKRYAECDADGHLNPVESENVCNYCYRRLQFESPEADLMRLHEETLPVETQNLNIPLISEKALEEVKAQIWVDRKLGIERLAKELGLPKPLSQSSSQPSP